ncbi:MAG: type II toxin-antitoxin system VapB family antitoxin [Luteolibacter sp.]|jgi:Arc/MetJ family transcription regulator
MKTTIEIDEVKLDRIMRATGIGTMKEAVDWALSEALRIATINQMMEAPWSAEEARGVVDANYDLIAIRNGGAPTTYSAAKRGRRKKS